MKTINVSKVKLINKQIDFDKVKTDLIEEYLEDYEFAISDYAYYKGITEKEAEHELEQWLSEWYDDMKKDGDFTSAGHGEQVKQIFQESINDALSNLFLSVELDSYDFNKKEITLDLWVAFGGPSYYFEAVYNEDGFVKLKDDKEDLKQWLNISDMLAIHEIGNYIYVYYQKAHEQLKEYERA